MKVYGTIYMLVKHQGDYDEYRMENICALKTKALADHFKHRYECAYQKLHGFYSEKAREIGEIYPDIMQAPDDIWELWYQYCNKRNKFRGANFGIEEIQLRRFNR